FGCDAKRFGNFHTGFQLDQARFGDPGFRVGFWIIDSEVEFYGVVIDAMVTLDRAHLVTVRLALCAQPCLILETDCFNDQSVSLPPPDGVAIPPRVGIVRKFAPVHPDFSDRVLTFEKHQNPSRNVNDLERPNDEQNARNTHRVAFQNGIVAARRRFGTVSRFVGVVLCLSPGSQWREVVAGTLTAPTRRKLPYAGQVMTALTHKERRQ